MKKRLFYIFLVLIIVISFTGCNKKEMGEKSDNIQSAFTITCAGSKEKFSGMETQNTTTYYFNENQYATDYSVVTTQIFTDKNLYKEYKAAQEESTKSSEENITYNLESDDKKLTLVFTMTIKNINVDDTQTEEEKESLKASSILKSNEELKTTCNVDGIDKNKIK